MNLFTGILSAAWWTQKATSVPIVAAVVVIGLTACMASAGAGLWWLWDTAGHLERQACALAQASAKNDAEAEMRKRVRASEEIAARRRSEVIAELQKERERNEELETALAKVPKAQICYPKDIARRLNNGR